jgi:hypothetical protein
MTCLKTRLICNLSLGILALSACNRPAVTATVEPGVDIVFTAAAQTVEAQLTAAVSGSQPTATFTPANPTNTSPAPTNQPGSTLAPSLTPGPSEEPTEEIPCDRATFVKDVTFPDGTTVLGGEIFEKTWRLKNNGTCTWNASYSLIFDSGAAMDGPASVTLTTGTVAPDEEIEVTVQLKAPIDAGTYRGNWKLRNAAGVSFGLGPEADKVFWVEIEVAAPTPIPNPSSNLTYNTTHQCDGKETFVLGIENTGNVAFESVELTLLDVDAAITLYGPVSADAPFMGQPSECPPGGDSAPAGKTRYVGAPASAPPPPGNALQAMVKLCTEDGLEGICQEKTVNFNAP